MREAQVNFAAAAEPAVIIVRLSTVVRSRAASSLAALLLGACGPGVSADPVDPRDPAPAAGACGLAHPAFCDSFDQASAGGRGGDLDERFWGVGRLSQLTNVSQGANNPFPVAQAAGCDGPRAVAVDGSDYFFCARPGESPALRQAFNDGGGIILHAFHARRPFDFAGRIGTVVFDVDGSTAPGAWFELWIVDEPVPAVHTSLPGMDALPRTGVGLVFQECNPMLPTPSPGSGLKNVLFVSDHQLTRTIGLTELDESGCFSTAAQTLNRLEVRIGERAIEVRASAPGDPAGLHRVALISGLDLPLDRGYVHFETLGDNAAKFGGSADQTRVWDNLGFDGPFLPLPRAHDLPDHLEPWTGAGATTMLWNTAYVLLPTNQQTFRVDGLDLFGAGEAFVDLSTFGLTAGGSFRLRFNQGTWREAPFPFSSDTWRAVSVPVSVADLVTGTNTLELATEATSAPVLIANVDLTVAPR